MLAVCRFFGLVWYLSLGVSRPLLWIGFSWLPVTGSLWERALKSKSLNYAAGSSSLLPLCWQEPSLSNAVEPCLKYQPSWLWMCVWCGESSEWVNDCSLSVVLEAWGEFSLCMLSMVLQRYVCSGECIDVRVFVLGVRMGRWVALSCLGAPWWGPGILCPVRCHNMRVWERLGGCVLGVWKICTFAEVQVFICVYCTMHLSITV